MTIDVFIRNVKGDILRQNLYKACVEAWGLDPIAQINTVDLYGPTTLDSFHWNFRVFSEMNSNTDPYVISDDDILPLGADWISKAIAVAERHPDYAILVANQVNHSARIKPQGYEVQPREMCGSPALVRKGMIDWSKLSGPGRDEDAIIGAYCKEHELKIGTMVEIDVNHIGMGFSTMNPDYWLKY